jgi:ATP-dependent Clp protease ATP-binding subunit ClpB
LIADLNKRLKDKQLKVEISDAAKEHIIDSAYDPIYGARPLKRFIQSKIETLLAREIIGGDIEPDTTLEIDYDNSTLVIK